MKKTKSSAIKQAGANSADWPATLAERLGVATRVAKFRAEQEYDTEFRVLWPDGSVHWLKAAAQVFLVQNRNAHPHGGDKLRYHRA